MMTATKIKNPEKNLSYLKYFSTELDKDTPPDRDTLYLFGDDYLIYNFFDDTMIKLDYFVGEDLRKSIVSKKILRSIASTISFINLVLHICLLIKVHNKSKEEK